MNIPKRASRHQARRASSDPAAVLETWLRAAEGSLEIRGPAVKIQELGRRNRRYRDMLVLLV
jgi:hypothetical protein